MKICYTIHTLTDLLIQLVELSLQLCGDIIDACSFQSCLILSYDFFRCAGILTI